MTPITIPDAAVRPEDAIKLIERLAFGYEVMFEKLCHISGTSGESPSWYMAKAREATDRISPLHSLSVDSNKPLPGDCKRQYRDVLTRITAAIPHLGYTRAAALEDSARLDAAVAALASLTSSGIPQDVQELLVRGDVAQNIAPGSLSKAIAAAIRSLSGSGDGWLPMNHPNLPKNGKSVIIFDSFIPGKDGFAQVIARFDKTHGWHVSASVVGGKYIRLTNPLKWRPLPSAPADGGENNG